MLMRVLAVWTAFFFFNSAAGLAADVPQVGDTATDFTLNDLAGKPVKLSDCTAKGPVVVVVLRGYPGYQCPLCTKQLAKFFADAEEFKNAGVETLFIYPGPADQLPLRAKEFVKGKTLPAQCRFLIDPDYVFTKAYHLRWDAKNETAYPSTFVINGKNKIVFAKISMTHGGRTDSKEILKAIPAQ